MALSSAMAASPVGKPFELTPERRMKPGLTSFVLS